MRATVIAIFLLLGTLSNLSAASIKVQAFDHKGQLMNAQELLRYIAPASRAETGIAPADSGLYLTDLDGRLVEGRPWWESGSDAVIWQWKGALKIKASIPWPIIKDGFSTITLDGAGKGYTHGQTILLNEEAAITAYRQMQRSLKLRSARKPAFSPSKRVKKMVRHAQSAIARAHAANTPRKRAKLFDKALSAVSYAWQQMLFEHGRQVLSNPTFGPRQRFGLSLDETLTDRMHEFEKIADQIAESGATWVRLVFDSNARDFTYAQKNSFAPYDKFVGLMKERKIRVMGSILDSMLWPNTITPSAYHERSRNLALHYKDTIRSWEIASEPNANWLGGKRSPLAKVDILLAIQKGVIAVKSVDKTLETVATLHWWEGTAHSPEHALFPWLDWSVSRGFGHGIDVIALSIYPHRHPLGIAFDPVYSELHRRFPQKRLMMGGFSYADSEELQGYWWLEKGNVRDARKDLLVLYLGVASSIPNGIAGVFYWPTLRLMLPPEKKPTSVYSLFRRIVKRLKK